MRTGGDKCQNCVFSKPLNTARTAEEWEERAKVFEKQADDLNDELEKLYKGFWSFLSGPSYDSGHDAWVYAKSKQFDALARAKAIRNNVQCHRFPEVQEVAKTHWCGEHKSAI
jgi:hypothetical protein